MGTNNDNDLPVQEDSSGINNRRNFAESENNPEEIPPNVFEGELRSIVMQSGPRYHPVFDKFEGKHVTQFLNIVHESDMAVQRQKITDRNYTLAYFFTFVGIFVFLAVILLPGN